MNKIKNLLASIVLINLALSCHDLAEVNINDGQATEPILSQLLTGAILYLQFPPADPALFNDQDNYLGETYVQYVSGRDRNRYGDQSFGYFETYTKPQINLQTILTYNTSAETMELASAYGSNGNQIAVAKILQAYYFLMLTDRWGDVPYSEALKTGLLGEQRIYDPKFDQQKDIYLGDNGIFKTLESALNAIDEGQNPQGDILFYGNMDMWIKMANSLRLIAALRLSEIAPEEGQQEFSAALNAEGGLISTNLENTTFRYSRDYPNPRFDRDGVFEFVSDVLVNYMNMDTVINPHTSEAGKMDQFMDPRLPVFAVPVLYPEGLLYVGLPFHLMWYEQRNILEQSQVSILSDLFLQEEAEVTIISYAQLLFCRAEAALRGWTSEDPEQLYYEAIFASLEQYGVESGYNAFITNSEIAWKTTVEERLEQISNQKWVAFFMDGFQAWYHWRRTGYPTLRPYVSDKASEIPRRLIYPVEERDLNSENYQTAIAQQPGFNGVNDMNGRVWWDAK